MTLLASLFFRFAQVGLFSIGGGMATLPFLYEMSQATGWFTTSDIANMIAVSECTPGAIGVNMATYAGSITAGILGGVVATLGLVTPSVIVIVIIARFLEKFRDSIYVKRAFAGLRPASIAMISAAAINVAAASVVDAASYRLTGNLADFFRWPAILLALGIALAQKKLRWHPVVFIALSAVAGIVFRF